MDENIYIDFIRTRIVDLREAMGVSEHKMSLDLDKNGSYINAICCGAALPSVKELFNIMSYLGVTPNEFFAPLNKEGSFHDRVCRKIKTLNEGDLNKVNTFLHWIMK